MYKLLIVDDEYLVREGLRATVDWASLDVEVIGTADNGKSGLDMAREKKPDLIIADVRMPIMDGLDMAKALFDEKADLAVIMYSGYKDFEYARRAIDSGVYGFLLKPIQNDELILRVGEMINKLQEKRQSTRMASQFKSNIPLIRRQQFEKLFSSPENYGAATEELRLLGVTLPAAGTLLYSRTNGDAAAFVCAAKARFSDVHIECEEFGSYAVMITALGEAEALARLNGLLDELLKATEARFSVALCAFDGDVARAFKRAEELSRNTMFSAINAIATEDCGGRYKKLVRDALAVIERDYSKKLSVRSVADKLYTSESNLMHEFKNQVGKTFNECLTDFRMLKAQELLILGEKRVGEIAYAVGYSDVKYFGQVFKEYMGCTPSEFIDKRK